MKSVELRGEFAKQVVNKCIKIIEHQRTKGIQQGLKGFLFWGKPGTGKSTCASVIADKVANTRTGRYDSGDISDEKYGRSESKIKNIFSEGYQLVIFDDVDGLFLTRSYGVKLETWYLTHLNVLFRMLDELDSSKTMVIMTTNRFDLIDDALKDRLLKIEFPMPSKDDLILVARRRARTLDISTELIDIIIREIESSETQMSFRDVETLVISHYVEMVSSF